MQNTYHPKATLISDIKAKIFICEEEEGRSRNSVMVGSVKRVTAEVVGRGEAGSAASGSRVRRLA